MTATAIIILIKYCILRHAKKYPTRIIQLNFRVHIDHIVPLNYVQCKKFSTPKILKDLERNRAGRETRQTAIVGAR